MDFKNIKLLVLDFDGVLTDNCVFVFDNGKKENFEWEEFEIMKEV